MIEVSYRDLSNNEDAWAFCTGAKTCNNFRIQGVEKELLMLED